MRILYHHRTLGDGAEGIHIAEMIRAFRALGHHVEVRGLAAAEGSARRTSLVQNVKRLLPSAAFEVASLASNAPDYVAVHRTIRSMAPDFVYKRHARHDLGALSAARRAGVPSVLEVNCLFTSIRYRQFEPMALKALARYSERRALTLADIVVAVSTPLARRIERLYGVSAMVLPNGVDPARFDPSRADGGKVRARFGLGTAPVVGWAGVIRRWHGLELLIDALSGIDGCRLLIVGDGPERSQIERRAANAGLADRLAVTGRVPPNEMPDYLAAMDIAVVARDRTGVASPMKLLEYMAMARPVVAPRMDNIRDLVTDQRDGLLFAAGDVADLRQNVRRLVEHDTLRRQLGDAARNAVQTRLNWRRNAERVIALVGERATAAASRRAWVPRSL